MSQIKSVYEALVALDALQAEYLRTQQQLAHALQQIDSSRKQEPVIISGLGSMLYRKPIVPPGILEVEEERDAYKKQLAQLRTQLLIITENIS